jgi:tRNA uridine 5-carboxymethylaminomethyl modification enzyme
LRQDNADERLTPIGHSLGLISKERFLKTNEKYENVSRLINYIQNTSIAPVEVNQFLNSLDSKEITQKQKISSILVRPRVRLQGLIDHINILSDFIKANDGFDQECIEEVELKIKYNSYIVKEQELALKMIALEQQRIPENFDFNALKSLSSEAREKLSKLRPLTVGQAGRISGVSPSDISVLIVYLNQ